MSAPAASPRRSSGRSRQLGLAGLVGFLAAVNAAYVQPASGIPECAAAGDTEIGTDIEQGIGFPVLHDDVMDASLRKMVCHDQFCAEYNGETKTPIWVIERLTPDIVSGDTSRPDPGWDADPLVLAPPSIPSAFDRDYTNSGFARGHMAASADFKCHVEWMEQTFVFSNAVPQIQNGFNGAIWRSLESRVQKLAANRDELIVITGPVAMRDDGREMVISAERNACRKEIRLAGLSKLRKPAICDANDEDPSDACAAGVAVPAGLFKIVHNPENNRTFAFLMSNEDHRPFRGRESTDDYLEMWRVSIDVLEELTSLEFFPNVTLRASDVRNGNCVAPRWR